VAPAKAGRRSRDESGVISPAWLRSSFGAMNWLDTETKAILQRDQEPKSAPPKAAEFALVLIRKGTDDQRLVRAIRRINEGSESEAIGLSRLPTPVTINPGLNEAEALFGQFELICCDAVAVFIRSEVILEQGEQAYLHSLFEKVSQSPEFKPTRIDVLEVPATEAGERFVDQFLGNPFPAGARPVDEFSLWVPYKKARLMKHWATRVGAQVQCDAVQNPKDEEDIL
jgi:hypothetical protein